MLPVDVQAINQFDTKHHIYLCVVKNTIGRDYLAAKQIGWFGRIFMYLGWSNASMSNE